MIDIINQIADFWIKYFGVAVLQNTIFIAVIFLILKSLKNLPAKIKYAISLIALFKLLIPPFIPIYFTNIIKQNGITEIAGDATRILGDSVTIIPLISREGIIFLSWIGFAVMYLAAVGLITMFYHLRINRSIKNVSTSSHYPNIKICQSDCVSTPMSLGLFPRKIYLPLNWQELPDECHDIMLHHEYAHIQNYDGVFQFFQNIIQAIYFFHPLVWMLNKSINEYREMVCDDYAVRGSQLSPVKFSRYLVQIAETISLNRWNSISASALIKQKNLLLNRINYQVKEQSMKRFSKTKASLIFLAVILLMVPLSLYSRVAVKLVNDEPLYAVATTGKIYGKVIDQGTGEGISDATVYLNDHEKEVKTDVNGNFYIIGLEEGRYKVFARKYGYMKVLIITDLDAEKSFKIEFKLKKAIVTPASPPPVSENDPPPPPPIPDVKSLNQKPEVIGGYSELSKYVVYPKSAKKEGLQGATVLKVLVGVDGKVKKANVAKSLSKDCDESAKKAVYSVKFKPGMRKGKPKELWVSIPVKFILSD